CLISPHEDIIESPAYALFCHGLRPQFAQLYIYDTEHEVQNRLGIMLRCLNFADSVGGRVITLEKIKFLWFLSIAFTCLNMLPRESGRGTFLLDVGTREVAENANIPFGGKPIVYPDLLERYMDPTYLATRAIGSCIIDSDLYITNICLLNDIGLTLPGIVMF
ncbi:hypothetical protein ACJX0J_029149, partial [Zea mays]